MSTPSKDDARLEAIIQSDEFRTWTERLAQCFDDKARRDAIVREVQVAVAREAAGLSDEAVAQLQREALTQLFRSARPDEVPATSRTAEE